MSHFIVGVLIPLPCDDPLDAAQQAMRPFEGEGGKTDGWFVMAMQWSRSVDATPYAYIDLEGNWHERAVDWYPEERERDARLCAVARAHVEHYGFTQLELLRKLREAVPEAITNWHREWQQVVQTQRCLVVFVWCHG